MDFGMLPPEITSALIHSGPGAGSLIEASAVWQQLSVELEDSVGSYVSVLSSLAASWRGPSSTAMAKAIEPYLAWLRTTAQQCEQVGSSVRAVIAAFELTHFTVVQPALVSANRTRLAWLLATNFFGINLPAIAETEAEYVAMWVNNSAAMYRYAASSASAVVQQQFSLPPVIVDPTGLAPQANAVSAAVNLPSAATILDQLAAFNPNTGWFGWADTWANQTIAAGGYPVNILGVLAQLATAKGFQSLGGEVGQGLSEGGAALSAAEAELASALSAAGSAQAPTAAVGVGVMVGKLAAPPAVLGMLPAPQSPVQLAAAVSPLSSGVPGGPLIPMTPIRAPSAAAGNRRRDGRDYDDLEYGSELLGTVMQRPPSGG
ncbi:MAG: PPE family protein [Mycobacterium sp.]|uniref:PPE family protein n=1 Tax=Mycobacterium sp. TaxID=1785 RepID=UPI003F9DCB5C